MKQFQTPPAAPPPPHPNPVEAGGSTCTGVAPELGKGRVKETWELQSRSMLSPHVQHLTPNSFFPSTSTFTRMRQEDLSELGQPYLCNKFKASQCYTENVSNNNKKNVEGH